MKRIFAICVVVLLAVSFPGRVVGMESSRLSLPDESTSRYLADSIMRFVIANSVEYARAISAYEADIYIKGRAEILKRNLLMRFAHRLFPVDRRHHNLFFELDCASRYSTPNTFHHNFKAVNGRIIPNNQKQQEVLHFLNLNVYTPTAYNEELIMPVAHQAFSLYRFSLIEINDTAAGRIYKVGFEPRQHSQKLATGHLYIRDGSWSIAEIDLTGYFSFAKFHLVMTFGQDYRQFILPNKADLTLRYELLGNVAHSTYHASFRYNSVEWVEKNPEAGGWKPLDITNYYSLAADTVPIIREATYWEARRDEPLTGQEKKWLLAPTDSLYPMATDGADDVRNIEIAEQLTNTINVNYRTMRIRYSGILNPSQLGYSARNGITYKQRIRISKTFDRDRQVRFAPEVGFVFKRREIFFKLATDWEYQPERMGMLSLTVGNSNQSYSSKMMQEINTHLKDSAFQFDDLSLDYYRTYYAELQHRTELFHGFLLQTGIVYRRRIPENKKTDVDPGEDIGSIIREEHNDFIPTIAISYAPRQFYRMDGYRKEYVYSYYPSVSLRYSRAFAGVMRSSGRFHLMEASVHQSLYLGMLRRFNYHLSGGFFAWPRSVYFADFEFFARRNFPDSWEDKIGGVFNLLRTQWYNASDKYLQAHLMYQSPFMLAGWFDPKASKYIFSERFYISQLWTPVLPCYTEIGYGVGNHIFNIGLFAGFHRMKYQNIGFRFAFELFD